MKGVSPIIDDRELDNPLDKTFIQEVLLIFAIQRPRWRITKYKGRWSISPPFGSKFSHLDAVKLGDKL